MKRSTLLIFYVLIAVSFVALGARLVQMQIVDGGVYQSQADTNRIRTVQTKAPRGIVYDRNLRQLISNQPSFSVAATEADLPEDLEAQKAVFDELARLLNTQPVVTGEPDKLFEDPAVATRVVTELAAVLKVSVGELNKTLEEARKISPEAPNLLRSDLDTATAAAVAAHAGDWPGIQVMNELQYNYITRHENPIRPVTIKRNIPFETMQRVEEEHLQLPGISVVPEPVRQYSAGSFMSHILGYVGPISQEQYKEYQPADGSDVQPIYDKDDKIGQLGIESSMEAVLRGQKGLRQIEVNANQREVREIASKPPVPGQNVVLTIDSSLQQTVTHLLQDGIDAAHASTTAGGKGTGTRAGVAVVQKVQTGEVLALVSLPAYDDNLFAAGISQADFDRLNNDPDLPMFHRAIGGAYPPGSTFKMISAAAGLQDGVITRDTQIYDTGKIDVPWTYNEQVRTPYVCWKHEGHGALNVVQALQQSCDVFFYEVAGPRQTDDLGQLTRFYIRGDPNPHPFSGLGIEGLNKYMKAFGLGKATGIELPGEIDAVAPDRAYKLKLNANDFWSLGDTLFSAIGQGFDLVTPLQLNNVTATVANGGTLYQPQVVYQVLNSDGDPKPIRDFQPKVISHVPVNAEHLATVREGMRLAVSDIHKGTAYKTELKGVQIAGKTGTAEIGEVIDAAGHRRAHAWFTAFAPYENPEIAVTVLIEAGDESLEGSTFAVPVARNIFKAYFHVDE
jgi:penicillin-binding protein 2